MVVIQRGSWFKKFPTFKDEKINDCLLGWVFEGTDVMVDDYTQIYGDVTLQAVWNPLKLEEYFGYTDGIKLWRTTVTKYEGVEATVSLPKYVVVGNTVSELKAIDKSVFENSTVTSITIPDSVEFIGEKAFKGSSITSITLPSSLKVIGNYAFEESKFTDAVISKSVTTIGEGVFKNASITSITLSEGLKGIGESAFEGSKLTSVHIPETVTAIGKSAFEGCKSLVSANIPDGVEVIEENAFYSCDNLKTLEISYYSCLTTIKYRAFLDTSIESLRLPSELRNIESQVFGRSNYKEIFIDSSYVANHLNDESSGLLNHIDSETKVYILDRIDLESSPDGFVKQSYSKWSDYSLWKKN